MITIRPVLIAYDGSASARHAIESAAALAPGAPAVVVTARDAIESVAAHLDGHDVAHEGTDTTEAVAAEGAALARAVGLDAEPRVVSSEAAVGAAIADLAEHVDAVMVVLGAGRAHGRLPFRLGSVSDHVVHHAARPVLVVPEPALAAARRSGLAG